MNQQNNQDKLKIVVDEDWKAQAEAEKQKLAEKEKAAAAPAATPAAAPEEGGEAEGGERALPPASFATLVSSIVTQALFAVGAIEDPRTGRRYLDLGLAKHHIDTLAVLEEKTKGNLTDQEKRLLDAALYEIRMAYVQAAQAQVG